MPFDEPVAVCLDLVGMTFTFTRVHPSAVAWTSSPGLVCPISSSRFAWTLALGAVLLFGACANPAPNLRPALAHGIASDLSSVEGDPVLCEHRVPETVCTRHHPDLVPLFTKVGDWCAPHGVPESQCLACHPDLSFRALPKLPADADVAWLTHVGEDVGDLAAHAVLGKVTVFEFYADWCAACRKVDAHLHGRFASRTADFAYRKLNVVGWESPLGRRYLNDVPGLPFIVVYGPQGKPVRAIYGADLDLIDETIAAASAP